MVFKEKRLPRNTLTIINQSAEDVKRSEAGEVRPEVRLAGHQLSDSG